TVRDRQGHLAPDRPPPQMRCRTFEADRGTPTRFGRSFPRRRSAVERRIGSAHRPVAFWSELFSACSCRDCQAWKVAEAGVRVSVIVAIGMPFLRAASVIRCTSGVLFWLL